MLPHNPGDKRRAFLTRLNQGFPGLAYPNMDADQASIAAAHHARSLRIARQAGNLTAAQRTADTMGQSGSGWGEGHLAGGSSQSASFSSFSQLRAQNRTLSAQRIKDVKTEAFRGKLYATNEMRQKLNQSQISLLAFVSVLDSSLFLWIPKVFI
jgi:hypothetical protein